MKLAIVIPAYNEEAVLNETTKQLSFVVNNLMTRKEINIVDVLYVDDGSSDNTWSLIENQHQIYSFVHGLKLSHNVGHQNALWAGLEYSSDKYDAIVSIDADLQHDINTIEKMVELYIAGNEIVFGIRKDRATDSWFKKSTATLFYKFMRLMGVDIIVNHADFRLIGSKALKALVTFPERNLFLRGLIRLVGFKTTEVYFECNDRYAGESKYSLSKMLNFAVDGITSFSVQPLRWISVLGCFSILIAIIEIIYVLVVYLMNQTVQGWTSLLISLWFLGGLLLLSIGIIGEYIGKIYKEVKRRPRYIIEKKV